MRTAEQSRAAYCYWRVAEVAARLKVSRSHVLDLRKRGELDGINVGLGKKRREWRITPESLEAYEKRLRKAKAA